MRVTRGSHRIVLISEIFGFVIKFPVIKFKVKKNYETFKEFRQKKITKKGLIRNIDFAIQRFVLVGILDNWRESIFYAKARHPFCEPTYFSFFGLLNIQRKSIPVPLEDREFRRKCVDIMDWEICRDNHHFEKTDDFSFRDGNLMMVDYGAQVTQALIIDWGMKLVEAFKDLEKPPLE